MCEVCNGTLGLLGSLGRLKWYRCRNCGWEQTVASEDDE